VQAHLLPAVLSLVSLSMALVQGGVGNPLQSPRKATGAVSGCVASASVPLSSGRSIYLPTQSQESYHSASPGPSARRPSS